MRATAQGRPIPSVLVGPVAPAPRPTPAPTPTPLPDPFIEDDDRLAPVSGEIAEAPALPDPPAAPTATLLMADTTMIVKPLPSPPVTEASRAKRPSEPPLVRAEVVAEIEDDEPVPPRRRAPLVIAIAGGVAVVAVIALAIGFAGGGATVKDPAAARRPVAAATPAPEPTPAAVETPSAPAPEPEPVAVIEEPVPVAPPVVETESAPPPRTIAKPTTRVAKSPPVKRIRKPAPKWNPDSLFPAKK